MKYFRYKRQTLKICAPKAFSFPTVEWASYKTEIVKTKMHIQVLMLSIYTSFL